MRTSSRFLFITLAIMFLIIILLPGREILIRYVVEPITIVLWWLIRILRSIDQKFYWTILIFLGFLFVIDLFPGKNNFQTPSAYNDLSKKDDRRQFWKRIILSANENDGDLQILQSNLNQLHKEVSSICESSEIEPINLNPFKKKILNKLYALFYKTSPFKFLMRKHSNQNNDSLVIIQDFLKSLETTMEIKNGKTENKYSNR